VVIGALLAIVVTHAEPVTYTHTLFQYPQLPFTRGVDKVLSCGTNGDGFSKP
jgi:hypothetical protein